MISILELILSNLKQDPEYTKLKYPESNVYESWAFMGELLDPSKAYEYKEAAKGVWTFEDRNDITYFVRLTYQPVKTPFYEFKVGWFDENNTAQYHQKAKGDIEIDSFRSDTIAKIYKDEVISAFTKSEYCGEMHIIPLKEDSARYNFFLRMAEKFPIPGTTLIEDKYKCIIVKKDNFTSKSVEVDNPYDSK